MKSAAFTILAFSVFGIFSCDTSFKNAHLSSSIAKANPGDESIAQECLDLKMEQWYKAFNHYQLEGYNMYAADLKALKEADAVFERCQAQHRIQGEDSVPQLD